MVRLNKASRLPYRANMEMTNDRLRGHVDFTTITLLLYVDLCEQLEEPAG